MLTRRRHARVPAERAFTIVEVIIAAVLVVTAAVAVSIVVSSSGRTQQAAKSSAIAMQTANSALELLAADDSWARDPASGCASMALSATKKWCSDAYMASVMNPRIDVTDPEGGALFAVTWKVRAIDAVADGRGARDLDSVRPDFYRASVTLTSAGPSTAGMKPLTISRTINPVGRTRTGSLVLQVCKLDRQFDLRQPIGSCPTQSDVTIGYPPGGVFQAIFGDPPSAPPMDNRSRVDWFGVVALATSVWPDMATYSISPTWTVVEIRPLTPGLTFTPSKVKAYAAGTKTNVTGSFVNPCPVKTATLIKCMSEPNLAKDDFQPSATIMVSGLAPGDYQMTTLPGPDHEVWSGVSVPAGGIATVEAGERSRIMQVLRPLRHDPVMINLRYCDAGKWPVPWCENVSHWGHQIQLQPGPDGRAPRTAATAVPAGVSEAAINVDYPGAYSPIYHDGGTPRQFTKSNAPGTLLPFLWVDDAAAGGPVNFDAPHVLGVRPLLTEWDCTEARRDLSQAEYNVPTSGGGVIPAFPDVSADPDGDGVYSMYPDYRSGYTGMNLPDCPSGGGPPGAGPSGGGGGGG